MGRGQPCFLHSGRQHAFRGLRRTSPPQRASYMIELTNSFSLRAFQSQDVRRSDSSTLCRKGVLVDPSPFELRAWRWEIQDQSGEVLPRGSHRKACGLHSEQARGLFEVSAAVGDLPSMGPEASKPLEGQTGSLRIHTGSHGKRTRRDFRHLKLHRTSAERAQIRSTWNSQIARYKVHVRGKGLRINDGFDTVRHPLVHQQPRSTSAIHRHSIYSLASSAWISAFSSSLSGKTVPWSTSKERVRKSAARLRHF
jgi:hypothetical protein